MRKFTVVDLFCGVGGLTQGFKQAIFENKDSKEKFSFKIIGAVDLWERATEAYKMNHPEIGEGVITGDIRNENAKKKLEETVGGVDVIIGGPPCEAFSLAGKRDPNDPRVRLFYDYVDIVKRLRPHMFVMENVQGILTMISLREDISNKKKKDVLNILNELLDLHRVGRKRKAAPQYILRNNKFFEDSKTREKVEYVRKYLITVPAAIKQAFSRILYDVSEPKLLNAADYGVPQERLRVFFIGTRRNSEIKIKFPEPTHVKESKTNATGRMLEKWKTVRNAIGDLPPLEEREGDEVYEAGFSSIFMSRNRRMEWNKPSYTILASARHILLHPDSPEMIKIGRDERKFAEGMPRRLSIKECAAIQTFPPWYKFAGNVIDKHALIGGAVPPVLAQRIGKTVLESLVEAGIEPSIKH